MSPRRSLATLLAMVLVLGGAAPGWASDAAAPPFLAPGPGFPAALPGVPGDPAVEPTPPRVSFLYGEVSFWRPGATEWAPAAVNMPLAPGDRLYAGTGGTVEIQIGARAFVRAAGGAEVGLDNQEPDFVQFRLAAGHAALDLRELGPAQTIELATPAAAFTIERPGYYVVDVGPDATTFVARRGGRAAMTPVAGYATTIASGQEVVVTGTESPHVAIGTARPLSAWDRWNYERTDQLIAASSARYVPAAVYGASELDAYGTWRVVESYGPVWVPAAVPAGWVPYSTGRWIWDPRYGWTWLDDSPWGWAPYHYGRWVHVSGVWAWAPGPLVVRPVYTPALVVFLGGPVFVGRPICWVPLGWGEPVIPWWGRSGFVGHPWWGGWGGPRVVNNVVIAKTTVVHAHDITVYRNVSVARAVVGVSADRFGREPVAAARLTTVDVQRLTPLRGAPDVRPVAASVVPARGAAARPPESVATRSVVATRAPRDVFEPLRGTGLAAPPTSVPGVPGTAGPPGAAQPAPRLVPAPRREPGRVPATPRGDLADRPRSEPPRMPAPDLSGPRREPGPTPRPPGREVRPLPGDVDRSARPAPPGPAVRPLPPAPGMQSAPAPPAQPDGGRRGRPESGPEPWFGRPAPTMPAPPAPPAVAPGRPAPSPQAPADIGGVRPEPGPAPRAGRPGPPVATPPTLPPAASPPDLTRPPVVPESGGRPERLERVPRAPQAEPGPRLGPLPGEPRSGQPEPPGPRGPAQSRGSDAPRLLPRPA